MDNNLIIESEFLRKVKREIYNKNINEGKIEKYEKKLLEMLKKEDENENQIEIFLGKINYKKRKYDKSINYFLTALEKNLANYSIYLSLYKNYVMIGDYENAYKNIVMYRKYAKRNLECSLIVSMLNRILNIDDNINISKSKLMFTSFNEKQISELWNSFVDNYNSKSYSKCMSLLKKIEELVEKQNLNLELPTIKKLISYLKIREEQNLNSSLDELHSDLESCIKFKEYDKALKIINLIPPLKIKRQDLVLNALFELINNGYYNELESYVNKIFFLKSESDLERILKNAIKNQKNFDKLNDKQKEIYNNSIIVGRKNYESHNLEDAYCAYKYGYEETKQPIFLYYMGKVLHKLGKKEEAMKYFNSYVKVGHSKVSKAYLYIYSSTYDEKYLYKINRINCFIYNDEFNMYYDGYGKKYILC